MPNTPTAASSTATAAKAPTIAAQWRGWASEAYTRSDIGPAASSASAGSMDVSTARMRGRSSAGATVVRTKRVRSGGHPCDSGS